MARGEPGSVREGCLPGHGEDAYVMRLIDLHWSLIQLVVIDAALGEILTTCSKMDWLLRHGEKYLRPETRSSPLILGYKKAEVHYEPLGVVAAIVSWNYRMPSISPPFSYLMISFSATQRLVSHPGGSLFRQCHCHQVLGICCLVVEMVRRRY
jgi:hypothetical protein